MPSGAYVPAAVYAPHQQGFFPQQYPPQPTVPSAPAPAPTARRLSIRDPSTGLTVPVVTAEQVEVAVQTYHLHSNVSFFSPVHNVMSCTHTQVLSHITPPTAPETCHVALDMVCPVQCNMTRLKRQSAFTCCCYFWGTTCQCINASSTRNIH